jgi:ABC-type multidrug transport system ATPase subunit
MLADLDPSEGGVSLDGEHRTTMPAPVWRRRVGLVPARSGWWAERVHEHFESAQADERKELAGEMLLSDRIFSRSVEEASTGERQRLALIRALLARPRVLLLDEPTSSLDRVATLSTETVLRRHMERGLTVLIVTHDAAQAKRFADETLYMRDGVLERA